MELTFTHVKTKTKQFFLPCEKNLFQVVNRIKSLKLHMCLESLFASGIKTLNTRIFRKGINMFLNIITLFGSGIGDLTQKHF